MLFKINCHYCSSLRFEDILWLYEIKIKQFIMQNINGSNNYEKYFKTEYILFIICVAFLSYQSIDLFNEFMSGKTVTSISVGIISNTSLPAITLCPHRLDFSKLTLLDTNVSSLHKQYMEMIKKTNRSSISEVDSILYGFYWRALVIYFNVKSSTINIQDDIIENLMPLVNQNNQLVLRARIDDSSAYGEIEQDLTGINGQFHELKSLPLETLAINIYHTVPHVQKCYTLFSHSQTSWENIKMVYSGLRIRMKFNIQSFPITSAYTIQILMHSQNALPFDNYDSFNPGYIYLIRYSQWNIERLGKGYDTDCREYDPKAKTRNDCIFDCYQDKVKYHCHTQDFVGSILMTRKSYFKQRNLNLSKCLVNKIIHYESLKACEDQCHQDCYITYYSFTLSKFAEIKLLDAHVNFKHSEVPDLTIRHIAEMPLLTFICNFGGILGMWLGVSFYSIVEDIWKILHKKIISKLSIINITNNYNNKIFITTNDNSRNVSQPRIMTS